MQKENAMKDDDANFRIRLLALHDQEVAKMRQNFMSMGPDQKEELIMEILSLGEQPASESDLDERGWKLVRCLALLGIGTIARDDEG